MGTDQTILLTVEQAGHRLNFSRSKMFTLIGSGEITSIKVGRSRRIPASAVTDYVNRLVRSQSKAVA